MKDKKLFGKLNIIDILVIVVVLAAVALVGYKFLKPSAETGVNAPVVSQPNLRFVVYCEPVDQGQSDNIISTLDGEDRNVSGIMASPSRIFNSSKLMDAQIVAYEADAELGKLKLTVDAKVDLNSGAYTIGTQEIRIGNKYIIKTTEFELEGVIYSMEKIQ